MERTEIFELRTEEDVAEFCRLLLEGKERAPRSLRYTVAVTAHRQVKVVKPYDPDEEARSALESGFRNLHLR